MRVAGTQSWVASFFLGTLSNRVDQTWARAVGNLQTSRDAFLLSAVFRGIRYSLVTTLRCPPILSSGISCTLCKIIHSWSTRAGCGWGIRLKQRRRGVGEGGQSGTETLFLLKMRQYWWAHSGVLGSVCGGINGSCNSNKGFCQGIKRGVIRLHIQIGVCWRQSVSVGLPALCFKVVAVVRGGLGWGIYI